MDFRDLLNKIDSINSEAKKEPERLTFDDAVKHVKDITFTPPTTKSAEFSIANNPKFRGQNINDPKVKLSLLQDALKNTPAALFGEIGPRIKPTSDAQIELSQLVGDISNQMDPEGSHIGMLSKQQRDFAIEVVKAALRSMELERDPDQSTYNDNDAEDANEMEGIDPTTGKEQPKTVMGFNVRSKEDKIKDKKSQIELAKRNAPKSGLTSKDVPQLEKELASLMNEGDNIYHSCVKSFKHEKFGEGKVLHGEHTLSESGEVSHYDAKFVREDGSQFIVRNIPVANMKECVVVEHGHPKKKKKVKEEETVEDSAGKDRDSVRPEMVKKVAEKIKAEYVDELKTYNDRREEVVQQLKSAGITNPKEIEREINDMDDDILSYYFPGDIKGKIEVMDSVLELGPDADGHDIVDLVHNNGMDTSPREEIADQFQNELKKADPKTFMKLYGKKTTISDFESEESFEFGSAPRKSPQRKLVKYDRKQSMPSIMKHAYQPDVSNALAKAAGVDSEEVYFDDADLVYGDETVWSRCGVDDNCTFGDAAKALKKFAKNNPVKEEVVGEAHYQDWKQKTIPVNKEIKLAGDSIWDKGTNPKSVNVKEVQVTFEIDTESDDAEDRDTTYVAVQVEHDGPWTVYTDSGFERAISQMIGIDVDFTEQGMQDDGEASLEGSIATKDIPADAKPVESVEQEDWFQGQTSVTLEGDSFYETFGWIGENDENIEEAEYQGRSVKLNKPMRGDVKKFKVYVKNPKGNVVKVNFGDPDMRIKKSNPARRKSFRARHNCDTPGPKHKARYWSCRKW